MRADLRAFARILVAEINTSITEAVSNRLVPILTSATWLLLSICCSLAMQLLNKTVR